jgi:carbon monoxide dehydrogenase subunit G
MAHIQVATTLPADPATVWEDVQQLETHVEWMADAESIEFAGEQKRGVGTVMRVLTKVGPLQTTDVIRVVSWEPNRTIGVTHEGLVTGRGEFRLEPTADGTRFVWEEELSMPWFFGGPVGAWFAAPVLRWVWKRNLARLARRFG